MKRAHAHDRSDVIAFRWDERRMAGFWTFRCRSCKHEWEEKAIIGGKGPLKNSAMGRSGWALFARYWSAEGGGVKTKCPKCGAGGAI